MKKSRTHSLNSLPQIPKSKWLPDHWGLIPYEPDLSPPLDLTQNIKRLAADKQIQISTKADDFVKFQDCVNEIQYIKKQTPFWFVTINPKEGTDFDEFHTIVSEILSDPKILEAYWTYEVRAENKGMHCHILFHLSKFDKNFASRKIRKKLIPNFCGNTKHVYIKWINQSDIQKTINYINKDYQSKKKKKSHEATLKWRTDHDIEDYYHTGEEHLLVCSEPIREATVNL